MSGTTATRSAPRSLTDALRAMPDDALAALLAARPDLAVPLPPDLTSLAGRAAARAGVQRALDALDTPTLQVIEVMALLPEPVTPGEVSRLRGAPASAQLDRLRELGLVWGPARSLHLVRTVRDVLGPHPAGLGPPLAETLDRRSPQRLAELAEDLGLAPAAPDPTTDPTADPTTDPTTDRAPDPSTDIARIAEHLAQPPVLAGLLDDAPDGVTSLLDRLVWGPPVGQVCDADRIVRVADATGPVDWLLACGLLGVAGPGHVVLPREIGIALRGGRVHRVPDVEPPALVTEPCPQQRVSGTAAGAAAEAVRLVAELGRLWGGAPVPVLRAGGVGVRELRRVSQVLDVTGEVAARVVEIAHAAGLVADDGEADPRWAPTPAFDAWQAGSVGARWATLTSAWLATTRSPGLVGTRDARNAVRSALGGDLDRAQAPHLRRWALQRLAEAPAPAGYGASVDPETLLALLDWTAPRLAGRSRETLVRWALDEAAWLGVTGARALAGWARPLLDGPTGTDDDPSATAAGLLDAALPAPVDHVLLQADLTAIAPGPLEPDLAAFLDLTADVESRGGATVYRFAAESVRRALDAGLTRDEVLTRLSRASRTPVPQPLDYLITDTARRHGRIRVGAAQAYLRADDESVLAEILADRRAANLHLRQLAPTVLAAGAPPATVLETLRSLGLAPAAESASGDLLLRRPAEHRTPPRSRPRPAPGLPPTLSPQALLGAVQALRAADAARQDRAGLRLREQAATGPPPAFGPTDPALALTVVREAAAMRRPLWIGYVDAEGTASRRLIDPVSVDAGRVTAFDRGAGEVRTFSIHRVTGVTGVTGVTAASPLPATSPLPRDQAICGDQAIRDEPANRRANRQADRQADRQTETIVAREG